MFLWLFPVEAALGTRALIIAPAILGLSLFLVSIVDRSPYLSPFKWKGILSVAVVLLILAIVGGNVSAFQPILPGFHKLLDPDAILCPFSASCGPKLFLLQLPFNYEELLHAWSAFYS